MLSLTTMRAVKRQFYFLEDGGKIVNQLYSVRNVLEKIKEDFSIDTYDVTTGKPDEEFLIRKIQRELKGVPNKGKKGRAPLYSIKQVNDHIYTSENIKYFANISSGNAMEKEKLQRIKPINYYEDRVCEDIDEQQKKSMSLVEKLGLTLEEISRVQAENMKTPTYVTIEELSLLNKRGVVKYDELTEDEIKLLNDYHFSIIQSRELKRKHMDRFNQKKFQIMLEVLFNKMGFIFDDESLSEDIQNEILSEEVGISDSSIEKSLDKLQHADNYYEKRIMDAYDSDDDS